MDLLTRIKHEALRCAEESLSDTDAQGADLWAKRDEINTYRYKCLANLAARLLVTAPVTYGAMAAVIAEEVTARYGTEMGDDDLVRALKRMYGHRLLDMEDYELISTVYYREG